MPKAQKPLKKQEIPKDARPVVEVARELGLNARTIRRWVILKRLEAYRLEGQAYVSLSVAKDIALNGERTDGPAKKKAAKKTKSGQLPTIDVNLTKDEADKAGVLMRAKKAELDVLEKQGKLIDRDTVMRNGFELTRKTRDKILTVPAQICHELASETDPYKVEHLLNKSLIQALSELVGEYGQKV